jgi:hypothetical protein
VDKTMSYNPICASCILLEALIFQEPYKCVACFRRPGEYKTLKPNKSLPRKEGDMVHKCRSTSPACSPPQAHAVESMERVRSFVQHVSRHGYGIGFHREGLLLVLCRLVEPWWQSPSRWWIRLHPICTLFARFQHFAQEYHRWRGTPALEFSW